MIKKKKPEFGIRSYEERRLEVREEVEGFRKRKEGLTGCQE